MVGGDEHAFAASSRCCENSARSVTHIGANGQGLVLKLAINISLAVQMLAFSEGLLLAERDGVDRSSPRRDGRNPDRLADAQGAHPAAARPARAGLVRRRDGAQGHPARPRRSRRARHSAPVRRGGGRDADERPTSSATRTATSRRCTTSWREGRAHHDGSGAAGRRMKRPKSRRGPAASSNPLRGWPQIELLGRQTMSSRRNRRYHVRSRRSTIAISVLAAVSAAAPGCGTCRRHLRDCRSQRPPAGRYQLRLQPHRRHQPVHEPFRREVLGGPLLQPALRSGRQQPAEQPAPLPARPHHGEELGRGRQQRRRPLGEQRLRDRLRSLSRIAGGSSWTRGRPRPVRYPGCPRRT